MIGDAVCLFVVVTLVFPFCPPTASLSLLPCSTQHRRKSLSFSLAAATADMQVLVSSLSLYRWKSDTIIIIIIMDHGDLRTAKRRSWEKGHSTNSKNDFPSSASRARASLFVWQPSVLRKLPVRVVSTMETDYRGQSAAKPIDQIHPP